MYGGQEETTRSSAANTDRAAFVARVLEGEKMAELCREFDISRKTGYKIFQRYKDLGLEGLTDRSRRPFRQANKLPMPIATRNRGPPSMRESEPRPAATTMQMASSKRSNSIS